MIYLFSCKEEAQNILYSTAATKIVIVERKIQARFRSGTRAEKQSFLLLKMQVIMWPQGVIEL
jgi:hypothetical protein